jgi:hypothetical protein
MNPGSVFISHSSQSPDFEIAEAVSEALGSSGLNVWWDRDGIEAGDEFPAGIVEAIIRQHHFLFLVSPNSVASKWCRRELARADELGKHIVPLKLQGVDADQTPLELAQLHYVDLRNGVQAAWPLLSRALGLGLGQAYSGENDPFARDGRLLRSIAQGMRYGKTFTDALNLVRLLSKIGQECCETDRARELFLAMVDLRNYSGSNIDYDKVSLYLGAC